MNKRSDHVVACLGPANSFSHLAAQSLFPPGTQFKFLQQKRACYEVQIRAVDYAVLPIENNTGGVVAESLDAIYASSKIIITDELYVPVTQNLITRAVDTKSIDAIYSHPQAFAQCQRSLERLNKEAGHPIKVIKVESTSEGVRIAASDSGARSAAIGAAEAAQAYKIPILRPVFQDRRNNTTRFVVTAVGKPPRPTGNDRSSFLLEVHHQPNALATILEQFGKKDINLLFFESRPAQTDNDGRWHYAFFWDCVGHVETAPLREVYRMLRTGRVSAQKRRVRCLGSYPNRLSNRTDTEKVN